MILFCKPLNKKYLFHNKLKKNVCICYAEAFSAVAVLDNFPLNEEDLSLGRNCGDFIYITRIKSVFQASQLEKGKAAIEDFVWVGGSVVICLNPKESDGSSFPAEEGEFIFIIEKLDINSLEYLSSFLEEDLNFKKCFFIEKPF